MALPKIICLKSVYNNKYLRYRTENLITKGLLQPSGVKVGDPLAQFQVEKANDRDDLIHLKCRYSNKYLVRWSPNHWWLTASAHEPNEDTTSWTCTLFKPIIITSEEGDVKTIRLLHVQLEHYACIWRIGEPFGDCLFAATKNIDSYSCDVFTVVDWESMFKLPKHVAFKGDNGKFLGSKTVNGQQRLQFAYDNLLDREVKQEIFKSQDGTVCIKSYDYGKFWRIGNGSLILVNANDPRGTNDDSAMFRPTVVDVNVIALLNLKTTSFCNRDNDRSQNFLTTGNDQSINSWSRLEVIDLDK